MKYLKYTCHQDVYQMANKDNLILTMQLVCTSPHFAQERMS